MFASNIFRALDDDFFEPSFYSFHPRLSRRPNVWTESIALSGFQPAEVQIKEEKGPDGGIKMIIQAKREEGDDFAEVKKAVRIPTNVDHEKLKTNFNKDGVLILRAPFKETTHQSVAPLKINRSDTWNGIWGEMERLNDHVHSLVDANDALKFPRTEFIANADGKSGVWKMHVNIGKGFTPDEVKLRNVNGCVKLEAKKEVKSADGGISSRYLSETVTIPDGVQQDQLKSRLFDNGDLVLEAPCNKIPGVAQNQEGETIPIEAAKAGDTEKMTVDN